MKGANGFKLTNKNQRPLSANGNNAILEFKAALERIFFADVAVQSFKNTARAEELVIALHCNFTLTESLFHFNNGNWGGFKDNNGNGASELEKRMFELSASSNIDVDIKELSIHLKDTSIVISKLFHQSIPNQLGFILSGICSNFVHFTKGLTEMPYEIYMPIFEDKNSLGKSVESAYHKDEINYLSFWELYFESDTDSRVYSLKDKAIIEKTRTYLLED